MIRVVAYVRPHRLEAVKSAVALTGVTGLTVGEARGAGNGPETASLFGGGASAPALTMKARLTVAAPDDLADEVIAAILLHARTGEPGDGKIFLEPLEDALRIRTGERGEGAA